MARTSGGQAHVLNQDEFKILMKVTSASKYPKRDILLILFSYGTGLRAIELAGLKTKDVLDDQLKPRETIKLLVTKGGKVRNIYITNDAIIKSISEYVDWRISWSLKKKKVFSGEQPFFISQKGNGFTNITMAMLFKNIYKQAGLKGSSHSGRRTFATNLIERGADIKSLQSAMGHSDVRETIKYVESNPEKLKKIMSNALHNYGDMP